MNQTQSDSFTENIPAYALGALSRAEASALEAHLGTCQVCQAELARYQQISDGLMAAILPLQTPSSAVKGKLLASLVAEDTRAKTRWSFKQFALGAMVLVLIGMNLIAFQQIRDLRHQQIQLAGQVDKNQTILGMLTVSTEIHPISGDGFSGNLLLDREKNLSYLLVWNLPLPPNDRVYQIWLISPQGERIDAGVFRPEGDRPFTSTALDTSRNFDEFVGMEVTVEPLGGSDSPTGEQILSVGY
ncbi:MAG TPA: anti-sigma factor [Anaerolineales bacterium]|nr:anti-sigma factor [Anaerolineales bacterium]